MAALNDWLKGISIHALREEGDVQHHANVFDLAMSIHALRAEGDSTLPFAIARAI